MSFFKKLLSTSNEGKNAASKSESKRALDCHDTAVGEPSANKKQSWEASRPSLENPPNMYRNFRLFGQKIAYYVGSQESSSQVAGLQDQSHEPVAHSSSADNSIKANGSSTLMGQVIQIGEGSSLPMLQNQTAESSYMLPTLQNCQNVRQINNNLWTLERQKANDASYSLYASINNTIMAMFGDKNVQANDQNAIVCANIDYAGHVTGGNNVISTVVADPASSSGAGPSGSRQKKEKKKRDGYPVNVKSFLSTGIFDGIPVKYVSWDRENNMRGIVRAGRYNCGCSDCKFIKVVNAYDFECHAGCKTKHPNNHIYFQNGRSMYSIISQLQKAPVEDLFELIQTITGTTLNPKRFAEWKEAYLAAKFQVQRRKAKDDPS